MTDIWKNINEKSIYIDIGLKNLQFDGYQSDCFSTGIHLNFDFIS